jgi:DNA-binding CsgD family transcriptional regulator
VRLRLRSQTRPERGRRKTAEIAERLVVSNVTVRTHVASLLKKLDVPDRDALRRLDER